jgi:hypothetical protein
MDPMKILDITTARLRLVAMTPEMLEADAGDGGGDVSERLGERD